MLRQFVDRVADDRPRDLTGVALAGEQTGEAPRLDLGGQAAHRTQLLGDELRKQGIDQEVADEALRQVGAGDERLRAEQLVAKRMRGLHGLAPEVQTRRLAGLLARKGYSSEVAWPVIREAVDAAPEHQRD